MLTLLTSSAAALLMASASGLSHSNTVMSTSSGASSNAAGELRTPNQYLYECNSWSLSSNGEAVLQMIGLGTENPPFNCSAVRSDLPRDSKYRRWP